MDFLNEIIDLMFVSKPTRVVQKPIVNPLVLKLLSRYPNIKCHGLAEYNSKFKVCTLSNTKKQLRGPVLLLSHGGTRILGLMTRDGSIIVPNKEVTCKEVQQHMTKKTQANVKKIEKLQTELYHEQENALNNKTWREILETPVSSTMELENTAFVPLNKTPYQTPLEAPIKVVIQTPDLTEPESESKPKPQAQAPLFHEIPEAPPLLPAVVVNQPINKNHIKVVPVQSFLEEIKSRPKLKKVAQQKIEPTPHPKPFKDGSVLQNSNFLSRMENIRAQVNSENNDVEENEWA
jgi:hypothetical protein